MSLLQSQLWQLLDSPVIEADCVEAMAAMPVASVDAIVCDPPYGLEFMGKEWDRLGAGIEVASEATDPSHPFRDGTNRVRYGANATSMQMWHQAWAEQALRVLKPGGHLLAFGGTRTYHRLACAIEDAGFEIRDSLLWLYGSGFPKSLDVSKAIDQAAGQMGELLGTDERLNEASGIDNAARNERTPVTREIRAPATPEAKQWDGWGTALKPGHEPIVVARKPCLGTVAANVLEHGTGALNIDGCRIGSGGQWQWTKPRGDALAFGSDKGRMVAEDGLGIQSENSQGRWPANVVLSHLEDCKPVGVRVVKGDGRDTGDGTREGGFLDVGSRNGDGEPNAPVYGDEEIVEWDCVSGCVIAELDAQSGLSKSNGGSGPASQKTALNGDVYGDYSGAIPGRNAGGLGDSGGASRFFYCAKTSRSEREAGLSEREAGSYDFRRDGSLDGKTTANARNVHPTVKPINLMRWLVRLVTPGGGLVLDPFLGSGSTGCAAVLEGFDFIGIEREPEYAEIAKARIAWWTEHRGQEANEILAMAARSEKLSAKHAESGQLGLELA